MGGLRGAAGAAATPAAFNLGLCRLRGSYPPPAAAKTILYRRDEGAAGGPFSTAATMVLQAGHSLVPQRWCCRRAVPNCRNDGAAAIPDSGSEIKNQCTKNGISRQNHASIPDSGPEIKNHCTLEGVFRQIHAVIPKFTP